MNRSMRNSNSYAHLRNPSRKSTKAATPELRSERKTPKKSAYTWCTRTQKGYNPSNPHKQNQDSFILEQNFLGKNDFQIFGVFDGHGKPTIYSNYTGVYGEKVSQFCKVHFPSLLAMEIKKAEQLSSTKLVAFEEIIFHSFDHLVKKLLKSGIDIMMSGTTCNLCIIKGSMLYVTNIGDSRSVLAYNDKNGIYPIASIDKIKGAVNKFLESKPLSKFHFDSLDRETVRCILEPSHSIF